MLSDLSCAGFRTTMLVPTLLGLATVSARGEDQPAPVTPKPITTVPAPTAAEPATPASAVIVTGERGSEFKPEAAQAVKLDLDLQHTPQSVTVMNEDLLRSTGAFSLRDALRSAPGVTMAAGEGGRTGDSLTIRGFAAHSDTYVDGLKDNGQYFRDTFNTQQVEVLKGPSGLLFGRGVTGGAVNLVTKKPTSEWGGDVSVTAGTYDFLRVQGGVGGPVVKEVLGARLDAYVTDADSFRDDQHLSRWGVAPSATVQLFKTTELTLQYVHQFEDSTMDYGVPVVGGRPAPVPIESYYGFSDDSFQEYTVDLFTATLNHRFNEEFALRNATRYADYERFYRAETIGAYNAGTGNVPISQALRRNEQDNLLNQTELSYNRKVEGRTLSVVVGAEVAWEEYSFQNKSATPTTFNVNVLNPQQPATNPGRPDNLDQPLNSNNRTEADTIAGYAMVAYEFVSDWTIILGVRVDRFHAAYTDGPHVGGGNTAAVPVPITREQIDTMVNPRAGLVWDPSEELSLYASYSTSSNPSAETYGISAANNNLDPEENVNYEIGAKAELFDRALLVTAAIFRLEKTNARTPDPSGATVNVLDGLQRTDGFELGAAGRIGKDWNVFAGYAYLDAEIVESNTPSLVGRTPANAPTHSGSIWVTYNLGWGFDLGGGCIATSYRYTAGGGNPEATTMPGYARFDVGAGWTNGTIFTRVNVFNVADAVYYDAGATNSAYPGAPLSGQLTVGASF